MVIFLIGFMGSGKTTTGKKLSLRLGYGFLDTDKQIIQKLGKSINQIFEEFGEERFREEERLQLERLTGEENLVVSTGGGLPCHGNNMENMNRIGKTVYLEVSPAALLSRLSERTHKRPLIKDLSGSELKDFIYTTLEKRKEYYDQSEIVVPGLDTDLEDLTRKLGF